MSKSDWLAGIHTVSSAFAHDAENVESVCLQKGIKNKRIQDIVQQAEHQDCPIEWLSKEQLAKHCGSPHHQGVIARYKTPDFMDEKDLIAVAQASENGLILALDSITDPGNLGACLRSADAVGITAVILPKDRSVGITPVVRKRSAGAADRVKIARVTNLSRALSQLKQIGYWVAGAAGEGSESLYNQSLTAPLVLVMGSEGEGIRPGVRKQCDWLLNLPMLGTVDSLNVSVATGVFLYEIRRQMGMNL